VPSRCLRGAEGAHGALEGGDDVRLAVGLVVPRGQHRRSGVAAEVYAFVRRAGAGRAIAVKGQDGLRASVGQPAATEVRRNGRKLGGLKVWPAGSSFLKGETYGWLKLDRPTQESGDPFPAGDVHMPVHAAGEEFCRQITAEQLVARAGRNGFRRLDWVKTRERNEALDCRVYARAAAAAFGMDGWGDGR
jgi:phage terminase large subunit GpA-like protein